MSDEPVLLLDVDGVLCPFSDESEGYRWSPEHDIYWSPENIDHLRALGESFEIVWCTGWEHHANQVIAPLHEMPPAEVIEFGLDKIGIPRNPTFSAIGQFVSWKLPWVSAWVDDDGRPFAWLDDWLNADVDVWAAQHEPSLIIRTDASIGMTEEHVQALLDWAGNI